MEQAKNMQTTQQDKIVFIEFLRIVACFLVIVNHTISDIFENSTPTPLWFLSLFFFFVSKIAVPVFLLITGYLMIDRRDSYQKVFRQILRIGLCLLLFSGLHYLSDYYSGYNGLLSPISFAASILRYPITNAYWYLYLYLGILLMLPFLQKMVCSFDKTDFHVFFLISGLFFALWPIAVHYVPQLEYTKRFSLPLFDSYICMLLLGCYLKRYCPPSPKWRTICIPAIVLMCFLNMGATYLEYVRCNGENYLFFDNITLFPILVASFCFFFAVSAIPFPKSIQKTIVSLGRLTFGIYLLSDFYIEKLEPIYNEVIRIGVYPLAAILLFEIAVFLAGAVTTCFLKKIPLIKELL